MYRMQGMNELSNWKKMAAVAQVGWWQIDLDSLICECSDYFCSLLELSDTHSISHADLIQKVRPDYQQVIHHDLFHYLSVNNKYYDTTFPLVSSRGDIWVNLHLVEVRKGEGSKGGDVTFGIVKRVDPPEQIRLKSGDHLNISDLLQRQNAISLSINKLLRMENLQSSVDELLTNILNFYHGERCYIFELCDNNQYHRNICEVVADGVERQKDNLQHIDSSSVSWWTQKMLNKEPIVLDSINELPSIAKTEYEYLNSQNICSLIATPLTDGIRLGGIWVSI